MRRLLAVLLLAALCLALGYAAGHAPDKPPDASPPDGVALWQTLPPDQLANVAEGILERISELEDELARVQELQAKRLATRPPPER